jgi:hypothetical protein
MATATKKKRKEEVYPSKAGASIGHTTNLRQTILRLSISMGAYLKNGREPVHALLKVPLDYLLNNYFIQFLLINKCRSVLTRGQCYKTYYVRKLRIFVIS